MKLHLPKSLLVAVLAAIFAPLGANGANGWSGNTYNIDTNGIIESVSITNQANDHGVFIRATAADVDVIINALQHVSGKNLTLSGHWNNAITNFSNLTIEELTIGENGSGSASIGVGTSVENVNSRKQQIVHINSVVGTISSLTISKIGVLTLDSATISEDVTNSGTLTLGDVEINGTVTNSGTLTLGAVTIGGTVTNSGTLKLTGTLAGSGSIISDGRVEIDTTGDFSLYDRAYKYANGDTVYGNAGFFVGVRILSAEVSYDGVVLDAAGSEYTLSNGIITKDDGEPTIFYVDGTWAYNAEQSAGASSYYVMEGGEMVISAGSVPTVEVDNHGKVVLEQGSNDIVLNNIVDSDSGAYKPSVISNAAGGNIVISNSGNKTLNGGITLANGGKVTLNGGTFGTSSSAITHAITSDKTVLAFENIEAYIGGGSQYAPWEIGNGATVHLTASDTFNWNQALNLTILTGGVLDLQKRQSVHKDSKITLAGGIIKGNGSSDVQGDSNTYGLDFFSGGTITVTEDSRIETNVGGHISGSVKFDVAEDVTLTMTGNLVGGNAFSKDSEGTMIYSGAAITKKMTIEKGTFVHNGAGANTATIEVKKDGTLELGQASNIDTFTNGAITGSGTVLVHFEKTHNHDNYAVLQNFGGIVEVNGWMDLSLFRLKEGAVIKLVSGQHWSANATINYDILLSDVKGAFEFRSPNSVTIKGKVTGAYMDLGTQNSCGTVTLTHSGNDIKNLTLGDGAKLTLGDGENESEHIISTITAHSNGNTIQLNKGATLNAFTKGTGSGTITLTGSGVYDLGDATKTYDSTASGNRSVNEKSNFTLSDTWTGIVRIQNASHGGDSKKELGLNLNNISRPGSFVELVNVSGFFTDTMKGNLILTKDKTNPLSAAWTVTNGSSDNTDVDKNMAYFKGAVIGDGTLKNAWIDSTGKYTGFTFYGDLSGWTGAFEQAADGKCFNLTLEASAYSVNAEIKRNSNAELHLRVKTDDTATFSKAVNVTKLTLWQGVEFASGGENTVAGDLTVAKDEGENISLTNDSTLSVTGGLTSDYGLSIAGGAGSLILSGSTQNTVNGNLSIASGNTLTLAEGSALSVNNVIQNDGYLDIEGTVNWTLSSAAGLTVQYYEEELSKEKTNRLGQGVITGLITGDGSFVNHGDVSATLNNAAVTIHTATGLVTAEGLVYYVMNSVKETAPLDPTTKRGYGVYSLANGTEVRVDSVIHVGVHDFSGPVANDEANHAKGFYVGEGGVLAIMGKSHEMSGNDILESVQGSGDIFILSPGYKTGTVDTQANTIEFQVDTKTKATGALYLSPYELTGDANTRPQVGVFLRLYDDADISSFSSVHYGYPQSQIIVDGYIGADAKTGAHIKNLSAVGCGSVYLCVNHSANESLVLGGDTTVSGYEHGEGEMQPGSLWIDVNHSDSLITIQHLKGESKGDYGTGEIIFSTGAMETYDSFVSDIDAVLDIQSFDYEGFVTIFSQKEEHDLHLNITLHGDLNQVLNDYQVVSVSSGNASFTIKGSGTYILSAGNSMTWSNDSSGFRTYNFGVLDEKWTGTVEVNRLDATGKKIADISGINFADYGNASSTVHFKGFKGYLTDDTPEEVAIVQNLVLTTAPEEKDEDGNTTLPAMDAYEISSGVEGQVQNYTGTISGDGRFVVSAAENMTFNLKGDISGWAAEAEGTETPALIVKAGEHAVNFSDNATVINADLLTSTGGTMNAAISNEAAVTVNGVVSHVAGGTLNMTVATEQGTTFNNTVDINSFKVSRGSVTFNNKVDLDKLEVSSGSIANVAVYKAEGESEAAAVVAIVGDVKVQSRYTEKGAAVLQNGMVIEGSSVTGGSAQNAAFEYAEDGSISNAYLENVSLSSSLQSLQEKSSISMENIVATNVYLAGEANFVSLEKQNDFVCEGSVVEYGRTYNEVTFTTESFKGMILDMSLAGQITMTVANNVDDWENADTAALTNVTILLEGFRVEGMADGQRVDEWFKPLTFIYSSPSEAALTADSIMSVEQLLNLDANSYVFVYYEQLKEGLLIHMSNIPEPSTATLSLLALAALAARRRRR